MQHLTSHNYIICHYSFTCIPSDDFCLRCTVGVPSDPLEEISVEACVSVSLFSNPSILLLMDSIVLCISSNSFANNCLMSPQRSNLNYYVIKLAVKLSWLFAQKCDICIYTDILGLTLAFNDPSCGTDRYPSWNCKPCCEP